MCEGEQCSHFRFVPAVGALRVRGGYLPTQGVVLRRLVFMRFQSQIDRAARIEMNGFGSLDDSYHYLFAG